MDGPGSEKRHYLRRLESLEQERKRGWESHWRDLARHFMPRRSRFLNAGDRTNEGDRKNKLEAGVGIRARRTLSSGMLSGLTSPARPWFSLTVQDEELAQNQTVKKWLHVVYERMVNVFARSNFYDQTHLLYDELAVFGTGVMMVEHDDITTMRCRTLTVGEFCLDVDSSGRVNTLYRRVRMTARQIMDAWPDTSPDKIKRMVANDDDQWLEVIHAVEPNPDFREGSLKRNERRCRDVYLMKDGAFLEESGDFEFPALCPRWNTTASDIYGSSPAMDALPDCRQLQKMTESGRLALEKEVNPPLLVAGLESALNASPGAINHISNLAQGTHGIQPLYTVRANLGALDAEKKELKAEIEKTFFNDLFMMINNAPRQMTAMEVSERTAEKMLLLGPVLDRLRSELFQPLIERVYGLMDRAGLVPPPPPELEGQEIKIEFISVLAQAQKQAGLSGINNTVAFIAQLAQATQNPDVMDKLNADEAIDEVGEMNGIPPALLHSDEEVAQMRAERQKAMAEAQGMGEVQQGAETLATGAKAMKDAGLTPEIMAAMMGGGGNVPE